MQSSKYTLAHTLFLAGKQVQNTSTHSHTNIDTEKSARKIIRWQAAPARTHRYIYMTTCGAKLSCLNHLCFHSKTSRRDTLTYIHIATRPEKIQSYMSVNFRTLASELMPRREKHTHTHTHVHTKHQASLHTTATANSNASTKCIFSSVHTKSSDLKMKSATEDK